MFAILTFFEPILLVCFLKLKKQTMYFELILFFYFFTTWTIWVCMFHNDGNIYSAITLKCFHFMEWIDLNSNSNSFLRILSIKDFCQLIFIMYLCIYIKISFIRINSNKFTTKFSFCCFSFFYFMVNIPIFMTFFSNHENKDPSSDLNFLFLLMIIYSELLFLKQGLQ